MGARFLNLFATLNMNYSRGSLQKYPPSLVSVRVFASVTKMHHLEGCSARSLAALQLLVAFIRGKTATSVKPLPVTATLLAHFNDTL